MTTRKILIVEDDESIAQDIRDMLALQGYTVVDAADSGSMALQLIAETSPDLVLMDINLKGAMDGVETADQIRQEFDIPVVYASGAADDKTLQRAKVTAPLGFIVKPFKKKDLHAAIEVALHIHGLGRKLRESEGHLKAVLAELTAAHQQLRRNYELASKVFAKLVKTDYFERRDVNYFMTPQDIACGDLILVSPKASGGLYAFVGDFTGHGLSAAIGAIPVSDMFYTLTAGDCSVSDITAAINTKLKAILPTGLFCCACVMELDYVRNRLIVWNGGMPDVLIVGKKGGIKNRLPFSHPALGVMGNEELGLDVQEIEMVQGDRIYVFSDGVIETFNPDGKAFGLPRLEEHFRTGCDSHNTLDNIKKSLETFRGDAPRSDDVTMVEITYLREGLHGMDHDASA